MSTKEQENAVTITPSVHTQGAQALVLQVRKMREVIPRFTIRERKADQARLNAVASVPPELVELTATAMTNERALVRGDSPTPEHLRDLVDYADSYDPLADELEALAAFVRHSTAAARYEAGREALNVYAFAQRLARQPATAGLAPYVADMRRALGRMRKLSAAEREEQRAAKAAKLAAKLAAKAKLKLTATT